MVYVCTCTDEIKTATNSLIVHTTSEVQYSCGLFEQCTLSTNKVSDDMWKALAIMVLLGSNIGLPVCGPLQGGSGASTLHSIHM